MIFAYGAIEYGWYFSELSAIFLVTMFIIGRINGQSISDTCNAFVEISKEILFAAFVIGLARAILIVLQEGQVIDTICYYFSEGLNGLPKVVTVEAMLGFQTVLNMFLTSSSAQAVTSMPLMIPLADLLDINRQIAVLAYQFGEGFSNLFWPTGCATLLCCLRCPHEQVVEVLCSIRFAGDDSIWNITGYSGHDRLRSFLRSKCDEDNS